MISPEGAVRLVQATEKHNEAALVNCGNQPRDWLNPSKSLVDHALERLVLSVYTSLFILFYSLFSFFVSILQIP